MISWERKCPKCGAKAKENKVLNQSDYRPAITRTYHCKDCHVSFQGMKVALFFRYVRIAWGEGTYGFSSNRQFPCLVCAPHSSEVLSQVA